IPRAGDALTFPCPASESQVSPATPGFFRFSRCVLGRAAEARGCQSCKAGSIPAGRSRLRGGLVATTLGPEPRDDWFDSISRNCDTRGTDFQSVLLEEDGLEIRPTETKGPVV